MLRALLPCCRRGRLTRTPTRARCRRRRSSRSRASSPATARLHVEPDPRAALGRARALAGDRGVVLATGSIYLVADLKCASRAKVALRCCERRRPALPADDRLRGADRGARDPRLLRDRLRASAASSSSPTSRPPITLAAHAAPRVFGINSDGLNLVVNLLILFLVVVWLALVYWTYADARRRILDPMLIGCATAASLFPFVGTIVYMIVRPPEYLEDVRERELEMQAAEARLHQLGFQLCPHCDSRSSATSCAARAACASSRTRAPTAPSRWTRAWRICPYCEAEVVPPDGAPSPAPLAGAPADERAGERHGANAP